MNENKDDKYHEKRCRIRTSFGQNKSPRAVESFLPAGSTVSWAAGV